MMFDLGQTGTCPNKGSMFDLKAVILVNVQKGIVIDELEDETFRIEDIYVPMKRRRTVKPAIVNSIAESMLEEGQRTPILVRKDRERVVLVEGLQRLEACRLLGDETIVGLVVQARRK